MAALEPTVHANAAYSRAAAVAMRVGKVFHAVARAWANRRHANELSQLSDQQLADIGLERADLAAVRRLPFGADPTISLADLVRQRSGMDDRANLIR